MAAVDPTALVLQLDETASFFLRDTAVRLQRAAEFALAHVSFVCLLYCRFLCPGGLGLWKWMQPSVLWVLVFVPLFVIDWRNFRHIKYLRQHRHRFAPHDSQRYFLIVLAECSYKVLLCMYLSFPLLRNYLSLQFVMLPYTAGYILHFVLGHFVPIEEAERPEGCNAVASLISELGRFLEFVLVISLSLKVDRVSNVVYDWQAAFWPCWGLEGIVILIVVLLLPVCLVSVIVDRERMLMLSWVLMSAGGLGVASFISMYNIALVLDENYCPSPTCEILSSKTCQECRYHLELGMWPWLAFLPAFALSTMLLKSRLAVALHNSWYQAPTEAALQAAGASARSEDLPAPIVMFRVTPTYYSRVCDPAVLDLDLDHASLASGAAPSLARTPNNRITSDSMGSVASAARSTFRPSMATVDPMSSVLSARGATYAELVESEQLCFVCYDQAPNAALLECGHAGMCVDCAKFLMERPPRQARCPICRSSITNVLRLRADLPVPHELFGLRSSTPSLLRTNSHHSARGFGGGSTSSWRGRASREPSVVESTCELERGDAAASGHGPTSGATALLHDAERRRNGGASPSATATSAALTAAATVAAELGQPLASPPWPPAARRHAVMVDAIRRPVEQRGWRLSALLGSS